MTRKDYQLKQHLTRRARWERNDSARTLVKFMAGHVAQGYGPPNPWWKRIVLRWALIRLLPCWLWQHIPKSN